MTAINNISPEKYVPVRKQRNKSYNSNSCQKGQLTCNTLCEKKAVRKAA